MLAVLIRALMRGVDGLLPAGQSAWAQAMRAEVAALDPDFEALMFALGCLHAAWKLRCERASEHGLQCVWLIGSRASGLGLLGAGMAVLLGCGYMAWAGAPRPLPWMNGLAWAFALASMVLLPQRRLRNDARLRSRCAVVLSGCLLACTALAPMPGVVGRWLDLGPVHVQPVWILLPCVLLLSRPSPGLDRSKDDGLALWMALAALVMQAELVWLMVMGLVLWQRSWRTRGAGDAFFAVLTMLSAAAVAQHWQVPAPVPFVDQVPLSGFERHAGAGLLLGLGSLLPLLPAVFHRHAREHGLIWGGLSLAAWMGWISTPLLGLGGSAILGYVLSLAVLPGAVAGSGAGPSHGREPKPMGESLPLPKTALT